MVILTTTYNCENYVEKSLMSIMSQRYDDFKCYITDDLSTDGTVEVIKKTISNDCSFTRSRASSPEFAVDTSYPFSLRNRM